MAKQVIAAGVPLDKKTEYGHSPLYFAATNKKYDMAKYLIESGAKIDNQLLEAVLDDEMLKILKTAKN